MGILTSLHIIVAAVVPEITAEDRQVAEDAADLHAPRRSSPVAEDTGSTKDRPYSGRSPTDPTIVNDARSDGTSTKGSDASDDGGYMDAEAAVASEEAAGYSEEEPLSTFFFATPSGFRVQCIDVHVYSIPSISVAHHCTVL